jgi:hypothetical protein
MVKMLNLLLYGRDNLHARAPSTNNRYSLVGEFVSFFVIGRVHELAFEVFQTWYLWPLPVVQYASGVDEELGTVFKHDVFFQITNSTPPQTSCTIPLDML